MHLHFRRAARTVVQVRDSVRVARYPVHLVQHVHEQFRPLVVLALRHALPHDMCIPSRPPSRGGCTPQLFLRHCPPAYCADLRATVTVEVDDTGTRLLPSGRACGSRGAS